MNFPAKTFTVILSLALGGSRADAESTPAVAATSPPRRIISLLPSTTELLFELGLGSRVVAVSDYCSFPPEVQRLPKAGGLIPNTELLVSLKPDLILADDSQKEGLKRAVELGYRVVFTPTTRLQSLIDLYGLIADLGRTLGAESKAAEIVGGMKENLARLRERIGSRRKPRVLYVLWWEPLTVAAGEGLHQEILTSAGGQNVASSLPGLSARISDEFVVKQNPDFVLVQREEDIQTTKSRQGWRRLNAVRNGKVFTIPGDRIARYGPRLVEGITELAQRLHPELELIPKPSPPPSPSASAPPPEPAKGVKGEGDPSPRRGEGQGEESQSPK